MVTIRKWTANLTFISQHGIPLSRCIYLLKATLKKQIQIINNTIMNWRWRAIAQRIDPAMLASTVIEYLLPKIEIGLLYAYEISDMCRG